MKLHTLDSFGHRRRAGVSLLEMLITISLGMIAFAAVGSLSLFTARSFVATGNYADLDRCSIRALDTLSRDLRQSRTLTSYATNKLTLIDNDNGQLIYKYRPSTGLFTRTKNGTTTVLLKECDYLNFAVYQRNPSNGFNFYPVNSNRYDLAKLVDVSWKCSRKILGAKVNTESVQTAKIVIRN